VPAEESLGTMSELRDEGKVRHVGLSEVGVEDLRRAQEILPISSVQNRYNLTDRGSRRCSRPARPTGSPLSPGSRSPPAPSRGPAAPWTRSPQTTTPPRAGSPRLAAPPLAGDAPDPGTSSVVHLEENVAAASLQLTDDEYAELSEVSG
jgi:aryl-alcohol dehydrogenase-like predicted oxidoreductase